MHNKWTVHTRVTQVHTYREYYAIYKRATLFVLASDKTIYLSMYVKQFDDGESKETPFEF